MVFMITIGILNLQGDVSEHFEITKIAIEKMGINAKVKTVSYSDEVAECDGLIISGGESTVIGKLIKERGIDKVILDKKISVLGTCAGMILLSKKVDQDQHILGLMDVEVKRNAFGRQKDSFEKEIIILGKKFPGIFIRAPSIVNIFDDLNDFEKIEILSKLDSNIIAIKQGNNIATSFHPELTEDTSLHEYYLNEIINSK